MEASWLGVGCMSYGPAVGRRSLPTLTNPFDWQPTWAVVYLTFSYPYAMVNKYMDYGLDVVPP